MIRHNNNVCVLALKKCVFYEIREIMYVLMFPRYFRITLAQWVKSTGTEGDRSINSLFTCYVNKFLFVKEWEKEKRKENPEVIGEEGDEIRHEKTKKSGLENKIEKKMEQRWTKRMVKTSIEKWEKEFENDFQNKEK